MTALTTVEVDLNVRVRGNRTFAGFEDVTPGDATVTRLTKASAPVTVGEKVLAVEPEDGICTDATVIDINEEKQLIYLAVDWHGFREMET